MPAELTRKLYRRGSSYETTIPKPLLFTLDSVDDCMAIFTHTNTKCIMTFQQQRLSKPNPNQFSRKLYRRGSTYEITIPRPLLFELDLVNKKYNVVFTKEADDWLISFKEQSI
jgi:hypothetical protein